MKVQAFTKRIVGVYDEEVPPVPIPNTVVKLLGAENTWLETARENRAMPTFSFFMPQNQRETIPSSLFFFYGFCKYGSFLRTLSALR